MPEGEPQPEHRKHEYDLGSELSERFPNLLRHSPLILILAAAPDATIVAATQFAADAVGCPHGELIGHAAVSHPVRLGLSRPNETSASAPEVLPLARAVQTGEVVRDELWWLRRPDGGAR